MNGERLFVGVHRVAEKGVVAAQKCAGAVESNLLGPLCILAWPGDLALFVRDHPLALRQWVVNPFVEAATGIG